MPNGTQIATAYVQVVPTTKGIVNELNQQFSGAGESAGKESGKRFGTALTGVIAGLGIGKALKDTISAGADLQQSIGGIETLYGESADTMIAYASEAFRTVGLSANDYMENVTSFSASLLQGLGGDTDAAAEIANTAMIDMGDNANKFGTDMQSIQNAYQGFAKQNYTMLDNLKLGYGGTKSEMERLLADATAISGVEYDIDNLADVYSAIHVIQEELGVTGTTASEASTTISGSLASMKAAFANVLGNLALGNDISGSLEDLGATVNTFLTGNLFPMVESVVVTGIPGIITAISTMGPGLLQAGTDLLLNIINGLTEAMPAMAETASTAVSELVTGLGDAAVLLIPAAAELITTIVTSLTDPDNLTSLVTSAASFMTSLVQGIADAIPILIAAAPTVITNLVTALTNPETLISLATASVDIMNSLYQALIDSVSILIDTGASIIDTIVGAVSDLWPTVVAMGGDLVTNVVSGITGKFSDLYNQGVAIVNKVKEGFSSIVASAAQWGRDLIDNFVSGLMEMWENLKGKVLGIADTIAGWIGFSEPEEGPLSNFHTFAPDMIELFTQGIYDNLDKVEDAVMRVAQTTAGGLNPTAVVGERGTTPGEAFVAYRGDTSAAGLLRMAEQYFPLFANAKIYLSSGSLVGGMVSDMDQALGQRSPYAARGLAV